jgi:hypothetical protein
MTFGGRAGLRDVRRQVFGSISFLCQDGILAGEIQGEHAAARGETWTEDKESRAGTLLGRNPLLASGRFRPPAVHKIIVAFIAFQAAERTQQKKGQ